MSGCPFQFSAKRKFNRWMESTKEQKGKKGCSPKDEQHGIDHVGFPRPVGSDHGGEALRGGGMMQL